MYIYMKCDKLKCFSFKSFYYILTLYFGDTIGP